MLFAVDPNTVIDTAWPAIGIIIPMLVATVTSAEARSLVKLAVAVALAGIAAALTAAGHDWSDLSIDAIPAIIERVGGIFLVAHATYVTAQARLERLGEPDFNWQPMFRPARGLR